MSLMLIPCCRWLTLFVSDFVEVKGILKDPLGLVAVLIGNDLTQDLIDRILGSRVNLTGVRIYLF